MNRRKNKGNLHGRRCSTDQVVDITYNKKANKLNLQVHVDLKWTIHRRFIITCGGNTELIVRKSCEITTTTTLLYSFCLSDVSKEFLTTSYLRLILVKTVSRFFKKMHVFTEAILPIRLLRTTVIFFLWWPCAFRLNVKSRRWDLLHAKNTMPLHFLISKKSYDYWYVRKESIIVCFDNFRKSGKSRSSDSIIVCFEINVS